MSVGPTIVIENVGKRIADQGSSTAPANARIAQQSCCAIAARTTGQTVTGLATERNGTA